MQVRYLLLLFTACLFFATPLDAALAGPVLPAQAETVSAIDLSLETVEAKLGRKLKFTERIALSIVRGKAKKQARKQAKNGPDGMVVDGISLTSMILGILAFVGVFVSGFAFFFALGALVLGIIGLNRINQSPDYRTGNGFAIAGIALGGAWLVLAILLVTIIVLAFGDWGR